jgi:hypothetical protein
MISEAFFSINALYFFIVIPFVLIIFYIFRIKYKSVKFNLIDIICLIFPASLYWLLYEIEGHL